MKEKTAIIIIVILLTVLESISGQSSRTDSIRYNRHKTRNVIGFTPSKSQIINGIAIGGTPFLKTKENDSLKIRGVNVEISLLGIMALGYVIVGTIVSPFSNSTEAGVISNRNIFPDSIFRDSIYISGLNLGVLGSYEAGKVKGVNLSLIGTFGYQMNGFSTSVGLNLFYDFNGLLIGVQNKTNKGKGLQVGLFNYCNECKGIQIGLWNKMGKRALPFINMRF